MDLSRKILIILILILTVLLHTDYQAAAESVIINEIMASNQSSLQDNDSDFNDWLELKNIAKEAVNLSGYYLSDKKDKLTKWQFNPDKDFILEPGDFLLIWADDEVDEGNLHTNFKLSSNGEIITLTNPDGNKIVDQIEYPEMITDVSYGRDNKNIAKWKYFINPSPERDNTNFGMLSYYWTKNAKYLNENKLINALFLAAFIIILILFISYYKINNKLKTNKIKFENLFEESPIGLISCNLSGKILNVNREMVKLIGAPDKEAVKKFNINDVETVREIWNKKFLSLDNKEKFSGEIEMITPWEKRVVLKYKVAMLSIDSDPEFIFAVSDISKEKEIKRKLKYQSFHDELTGLYNRRYFEIELKRLNKSRNLPISIIIGDLDNLKNINDKFGHKKGDEYIIRAAEIMSNSFREGDIVARIGGDEFAAILPDTDSKMALEISGRVKDRFKDYKDLELSIGCATKNENDIDLEEIFIKADKRMYKEKKLK